MLVVAGALRLVVINTVAMYAAEAVGAEAACFYGKRIAALLDPVGAVVRRTAFAVGECVRPVEVIVDRSVVSVQALRIARLDIRIARAISRQALRVLLEVIAREIEADITLGVVDQEFGAVVAKIQERREIVAENVDAP